MGYRFWSCPYGANCMHEKGTRSKDRFLRVWKGNSKWLGKITRPIGKDWKETRHTLCGDTRPEDQCGAVPMVKETHYWKQKGGFWQSKL